MDKVAGAVMPITDVNAWQEFAEEISTGARSSAHQEFLRRGGIKAEHAFRRQKPMGDLVDLTQPPPPPAQRATSITT